MAQEPIVLTTRTLGSHTGVSQVGLDVALALCQRASELRVRAWVPTELPSEVDGRALRCAHWEAVPPLLAARAALTGEAPPRAVIEHARLVLPALRQRFVPQPAAALEVVNGIGAHALYAIAHRAHRDRARASVLVVHESPRHFDQTGQRSERVTLQDALHALRSYDYRVFVSDRVRAEWEELVKLDPGRSFYIPNCVHEQRVAQVFGQARAQLRRNLGLAPNTLQIVCVGSFSPRKGQDLLLSALHQLSPSPRPVHVDFLGSASSTWATELIGRLQGTPLASRVRFLGNVDDVYERVHAADALVLASRAEAFPLAVLEAMALGTCVIAADVDGVTEQVLDEQTGLLFAREDVGALIGCLNRIARDSVLREGFGRAGRARYLSLFTRERQLARWSAALGIMLGRVS